MQRRSLRALPLAFLALVTVCANADKLTTDPNAAPKAEAAPVTADPRLDQPVTYQKGYARLHTILDDLTAQTGVTIRAGYNTKDWQVRDIPMFVSVRDVPLGKLLTALGDAAHVQLTTLRVEGEKDKNRTYRLYRTKAYQESISRPVEDKLAKGLELAKWSWDALVAYSRLNNPPALPASDELGTSSQEVSLVGRILASLPQDRRERIFAGEPCSLTTKDAAQSEMIRQLQRFAWDKLKQGKPQDYASSQLDPGKVVLIINVHRIPSNGYTGFYVMMGGLPDYTVVTGNTSSTQVGQWFADCLKAAEALQNIDALELTKRPEEGKSSVVEDELPTGFKPLKSDDDWKNSLLQAKVTIKQPTDPIDWKCSDLLTQVAQSAGLNIICQDVRSHKTVDRCSTNFSLPAEPTAADALRAMQRFGWFIDEPRKILVGWETNWRMMDKSLVPEETLSRLRTKLDSTGVELDDYLPLVRLNMSQFACWIEESREFGCLGSSTCSDPVTKPLWLLYDALSAEDKALARSDAGLPMAMLDPTWAPGFLQNEIHQLTKGSVVLSADGEPVDWKLMRSVAADPDALAKSVLHVTPVTCSPNYTIRKVNGVAEIVAPPAQRSAEKHFYRIELTGKKDEQDFRLRADLRVAFPVFRGDKRTTTFITEGGGFIKGNSKDFPHDVFIDGGIKRGSITIDK